MELVYLWVEDYKNIHKQEFNFSPNFKCDFTPLYEDGKLLENSEFKITPKENPLEYFYGKNINITAVVGENGTGKSSIIKLILMLIFYKKYNVTSDYENEIAILKQELKDKALFLIINTVDGYKKICLNTDINNDSISEVDNDNIDFYSIYFSYMLDTLQNKKDYWMWNLYHKSDNYETPILLTPNKFHKDFLQNNINLDDIEYVNINHSIKFYKKNIETKINDFFNPNSIKLYSDNPWTIQEVEFYFFGKVAEKFSKLNNKIEKNESAKYYENLEKKLKALKDLENQRQYKELNLLYIAFKILSSAKSSFQIEIYDSIEKWFNEELYKEDFIEKGITLIESNIDKIFIDATVKYNNEKINNCIEFHKNTSDSKEKILNKLLDRGILKLSNFEDISIILIPWLNLELLEDNKSFNSLSGGQKLFFTFMVNMMYEVSNLIQVEEYKTINLFLDEVEASYHPNWQKEFIKNISKALGNIDLEDKKINIFFSTHSPFILSDLPKENVIFLEKYKKDEDENQKYGNCKVSSPNINQTFGSNIHTLLSYGFFMENGLMGEFAKDKINKLIKILNSKRKVSKKNQEYYKHLISLIGEPFLKEKLLKMYDIKFQISKEDRIKQLEKELAELKK